jgi:hypothetical protein
VEKDKDAGELVSPGGSITEWLGAGDQAEIDQKTGVWQGRISSAP